MFDIEVMSEIEKLEFIMLLTRTTLITDITMLCGFSLCYIPGDFIEFYIHETPTEIGYTGI